MSCGARAPSSTTSTRCRWPAASRCSFPSPSGAPSMRLADPTRSPLPWYLGDKVTVARTALSPSGDWLLVVTLPKDVEAGTKKSLMAAFITASGNVETKDVRAKVGFEAQVTPTLLLLD